MNLLLLTLCVIVYTLSAIGMYKFIKNAHSKEGIWYNINPEFADIVMTFCPIINTLSIVIGVLIYSGFGIRRKKVKKEGLNKFFNIKK